MNFENNKTNTTNDNTLYTDTEENSVIQNVEKTDQKKLKLNY